MNPKKNPETKSGPITLDDTILSALSLPEAVTSTLEQHGFVYVGDLVTQTDGSLLKLEKIGVATLGKIKAALAKVNLKLGTKTNWTRPEQGPRP